MTKEIYNELYKRGYPHGGLGFPISWSGYDCKTMTALDVGCGHGNLAGYFREYVGVDISDYVIKENSGKYQTGIFYAMDIINVGQFFGTPFDVVLAIDVLEHFEKEKIDDYLKAIAGIPAREYLFSICCRESGFKDMNGNGLHLCVMSMPEWLKTIEKYFEIIAVSEMNAQKTFCIKVKSI